MVALGRVHGRAIVSGPLRRPIFADPSLPMDGRWAAGPSSPLRMRDNDQLHATRSNGPLAAKANRAPSSPATSLS
jgi:hypothetical protein